MNMSGRTDMMIYEDDGSCGAEKFLDGAQIDPIPFLASEREREPDRFEYKKNIMVPAERMDRIRRL